MSIGVALNGFASGFNLAAMLHFVATGNPGSIALHACLFAISGLFTLFLVYGDN